MAKTQLKKAISEAANSFALEILEAVKNSTLQELIALQQAEAPKLRGRPLKEQSEKTIAEPAEKKRAARNYPKCAYPRCRKTMFPRGKGFCGGHYKMFVAGEIEAADTFKKKK